MSYTPQMKPAARKKPGLRASAYASRLSISEGEAEEQLKHLAFAGSVVTQTRASGRHFSPRPRKPDSQPRLQ